jgi:iron complex outermembrane recepter protein
MKRFFIFFFVLLAKINLLSAQGTVGGKVIDANSQETLPFVLVNVVGTYISNLTNEQGNFLFREVRGEAVTLKFHLLGYQDLEMVFVPGKDTGIVVSLQRSDIMQEEFVVQSNRAGENSGIAYSNVSKEDIAKQNFGQDLPVLLNQQSSVVTTSDAGAGIGYTGIRIRGTDATRINVTINGIPVNDAESQGVYWVNMPDLASSAQNIQIQRGVGTSTNGSGAFGGSVNVLTDDGSNKAFAEVNTGGGSFNTWRISAKTGTGLIHNHWKFETRLSRIASDGYIDRGSSDLRSWYFSGGYYSEKITVKAITFSGREKTYQCWYGVPQDSLLTNPTYNPAGYYAGPNREILYYDNQTDNYQQDYYQLHFIFKGNKYWNFNTALHATKGKGYYEEYKPYELLADYGLDTGIVSGDLIRRKWLDNWFYGVTYGAHFDNHKKTQLVIGGALNNYEGKHFNEVIWAQQLPLGTASPFRYYNDFAVKTDFTIFSRLNYQVVEKINFAIDLQYRLVMYHFNGPDTSGNDLPQQVNLSFFNPKAAITYRTSDQSYAYISFGVGNKEPNRDDYRYSTISSRPIHETLYDAEAGWKFGNEKILADVNLYYMLYKNQLVLTGKINDVGEYTRQNVANSFRRGIEIALAGKLGGGFSIYGNTSLSQNKVLNFVEYIDNYDSGIQDIINYSSSDIAFSPATISAAGISWSKDANEKGRNAFSYSLNAKYVGRQYLDNTSHKERSLDPYLTGNFSVSWSPILIKDGEADGVFLRELQFSLQINNITNLKYSANGYTYGYIANQEYLLNNFYYPQAGVHYLGRIMMRF